MTNEQMFSTAIHQSAIDSGCGMEVLGEATKRNICLLPVKILTQPDFMEL
jgi:hypothetical protein